MVVSNDRTSPSEAAPGLPLVFLPLSASRYFRATRNVVKRLSLFNASWNAQLRGHTLGLSATIDSDHGYLPSPFGPRGLFIDRRMMLSVLRTIGLDPSALAFMAGFVRSLALRLPPNATVEFDVAFPNYTCPFEASQVVTPWVGGQHPENSNQCFLVGDKTTIFFFNFNLTHASGALDAAFGRALGPGMAWVLNAMADVVWPQWTVPSWVDLVSPGAVHRSDSTPLSVRNVTWPVHHAVRTWPRSEIIGPAAAACLVLGTLCVVLAMRRRVNAAATDVLPTRMPLIKEMQARSPEYRADLNSRACRIDMAVVLLAACAVLCFVSANTTSAAVVVFGDEINWYVFNLAATIHDLWAAGIYALASFVAVFCIFYPYFKIVVMVLFYVVLGRTTSLALRLIDLLGRWSLIDSFVMLIFAVLMPIPGVENVTLLPSYSFFIAGTVLSIVLGNIVARERRGRVPRVVENSLDPASYGTPAVADAGLSLNERATTQEASSSSRVFTLTFPSVPRLVASEMVVTFTAATCLYVCLGLCHAALILIPLMPPTASSPENSGPSFPGVLTCRYDGAASLVTGPSKSYSIWQLILTDQREVVEYEQETSADVVVKVNATTVSLINDTASFTFGVPTLVRLLAAATVVFAPMIFVLRPSLHIVASWTASDAMLVALCAALVQLPSFMDYVLGPIIAPLYRVRTDFSWPMWSFAAAVGTLLLAQIVEFTGVLW